MEAGVARSEHGLKKDAIGFIDGLIIGIASTAPAYSLAAVLAIVVVGVGVQAPAVLLVSFVPMFLIASAFYYMNHADPDCGTSFSWVTRAMGPGLGWVGGWAIAVTGILVIGSLAQVAAYYTFDLLELTSMRDSTFWNVVFTLLIIAVMTTICVLGTELSALVQRVFRDRRAGGSRARVAARGDPPHARLAPHRPRVVLRPQARDRGSGGRRRPEARSRGGAGGGGLMGTIVLSYDASHRRSVRSAPA
ncbi:MAG TPA: hypothetical protein VFQ12_00170 [Thermoleophilaceae bacterium]|nr:hypothetical protein [Thermoleophilaceae bacterium]